MRGLRHPTLKPVQLSRTCLAGALAATFAMGACGGAPDRSTGRSASAVETQTVTLGVAADRYLTELPSRPDLGKYLLNANVFDTLLRMDEHFQVEPMLAREWTYARATNTYRFMLRHGVRFHDGAELTAEDVKYTFDLIIKSYPHNYEELGEGLADALGR